MAWSAVRFVVGAGLGGAAWLALADRYTCTLPVGVFTAFYALCMVFLVGFVWAVAEVARVITSRRKGAGPATPAAIAVGLTVYLGIAAIAWTMNPVSSDDRHDASARAVLSVFWSAGFLQESGHYSDHSCGY
jgi:hypothetical protein